MILENNIACDPETEAGYTIINDLIKTIRFKLKLDRYYSQWIVFLDEIQIWNDQDDFHHLLLGDEEIDVIAALNPILRQSTKTYNPKFPAHKDTVVVQMKSRHRNSYKIALFLLHLKHYFRVRSRLPEDGRPSFFRPLNDEDYNHFLTQSPWCC